MPHVDVNGARLWIEEEGAGPALLFLHGGLGDSRLFAPQARALADRFRCIRFDLRLWGRSESPAAEFSWIADAVGVLDALGVERAAVIGLSFGGGLAIDIALAHPERIWAIAHVAGGVSGMPIDPYTPAQETAYDAAVEAGDLGTAMEIDFAVWAPLGADDAMRELWRATPDALGVPEGATPRPRPDAHDRLEEIAVPTLVIVPSHDPPEQKEIGATVARRVPGAQLVELASDHYLTLRHADRVSATLREFLLAAQPPEPSR